MFSPSMSWVGERTNSSGFLALMCLSASIGVLKCSALLMNANNGGVDHLHCFMGFGDGIHETVSHPCFSPSDEAAVAGCAKAIALRQVTPRSTRSKHPEECHSALGDHRHAAHLVVCWATAARSLAIQSRSGHICPCRG